MNLIERVKNILITPKTEWEVIDNETATVSSLFTSFVLPMAIVSSLGGVIRYFMYSGTYSWGMKYLIIGIIISFITALATYYLTTIIVDKLASNFGSEQNMGKSAQLVAYSGTPTYIAGLLAFIPVIGWLISIAAWVYGVYLMYLGIGPLKKTPEDKKVVYILVSYVIMIAIYFIIASVLGGILYATMGTGLYRY
ncbi:MAG: Yip1 family protein [Ferruginibacter sp.]